MLRPTFTFYVAHAILGLTKRIKYRDSTRLINVKLARTNKEKLLRETYSKQKV